MAKKIQTVEERKVSVTARCGRYIDGMEHPNWGPWETFTVQVNFIKDNPWMSFALLNTNWAEYYISQLNGCVFETEGYYLEIKPEDLAKLLSRE